MTNVINHRVIVRNNVYLLYLSFVLDFRREKVKDLIIGSKSANMSNNNIESGKRKLDVGSWVKTTAGEKVQFKFAWTIENFTERPEKTGESLCSSLFQFDGPGEWQIELYPKGEDEEFRSFLAVFVSNQDGKEGEINAKIEFSILDAANTKHNHCVCRFNKYKDGNGFGLGKFLSLKTLQSQASQLLPDDSLTILCEVTCRMSSIAKTSISYF